MLSKRISCIVSKTLIATLCCFSLNVFAKEAFTLVGVKTGVGEKRAYIAQEGDIRIPATEQIAALLTREFIEKAEFFIDMHSGSANQKLYDHVYSPFVGDEKLDALTFEFAKATGMNQIIMYGDRPRDPENSISFPNTGMTRGKPSLTTEIGAQVTPGTIVGEVSDYFGNSKQILKATVKGTVLMINETPPVKKGESPVAIGVVQ